MNESRRRFGEILLWSGFTNLLLVACFVIAGNSESILSFLQRQAPRGETSIEWSPDPLAVARLSRGDNEVWSNGPQRQLKRSLQMTLITREPRHDNVFSAEQGLATAEVIDGEPGVAPASFTYGPEDVRGRSISPILKKEPGTGQLVIGSFISVSLVGDVNECLDLGYSMLGDAGTSNDVLEVLASTDAMTMARICAKNGAVIISCRNDQITISPRRSRPDQNCRT